MGPCLHRGEDILAAGHSPKHLTVLIEGVGCLYERLIDGSRQIHSFQYTGDFCDLGRHMLQSNAADVAVAAVTDCRIGYIENHVLEELIVQYPAFGLALWRSAVLEASTLRAGLLRSRRTALQRIAHLLCEQLCRQAAAGIDSPIIPMTQIDLADAAGLSAVHINRTVKELQAMGLLSKAGRSMKVVDREKLAHLADFDGGYLDLTPSLWGWEVALVESNPLRAATRVLKGASTSPIASAP